MLEELDEPLRVLLDEYVDSYEKLDVVLFVQSRQESVHLRELARAVRLSADELERTIGALCASGLLVHDALSHVSAPARESMRLTLDALAGAYHAHPLAVVSHLSRRALRSSRETHRSKRRRKQRRA